jgi:hypothetical protein
MFREIPTGGDLYLLKGVLHDWDDASAREILADCRRALGSQAKLLIIDYVVGLGGAETAARLGDLQTLVRNGGRNRT